MPGVWKKKFFRKKIQKQEFISKEDKPYERIALPHRNYQKIVIRLSFAEKILSFLMDSVILNVFF